MVSRKRTLSCIGVGLAAVAVPLLSSTTVLVEASPLYQHRVRQAHRHVQYSHILEQTPRGPSSGFWHPGDETTVAGGASDEQASSQEEPLRLESLKDDYGTVWSLVADAARQHPDGAPRLKRKAASKPAEQQQQQEHDSDEHVRRRAQVTDKFVEDSTSAVLQEQGTDPVSSDGDTSGDPTEELLIPSSPTASNATAAPEGETEPPESDKSNYEGYNVTAQVLYEQSPDESTGTSHTTGSSDQASVIVTSSSKIRDSTSGSTYQPLRIRAIVPDERDGGKFLTPGERKVLLERILQPALLTWSAALRVEPVVGHLTVDKHQLFDNQTCGPGLDSGLPSPRVPSSHLKEGVPDTDMLLYLSIGFTKDFAKPKDNNQTSLTNIRRSNGASSTATSPPSSAPTSAPTSAPRPIPYYSPWRAQTGDVHTPYVPDDFICSGDYLAAASYCSTDQYDRPTAGMLHICITDDFFYGKSRNNTIVTIMHEVGHALGFNSRSMAHFRRPDGSPITPRVDGEIVETEVECTGPSGTRRNATVVLPSEEILRFRTVRGGVRVAELVTPSVLQVARNHFDCQNLTGAELESGEYSPLAGDPFEQACIGDHWERRLFKNDLMNPLVDSVDYSPFISTITLAYFADSGWYQVDLSMAELAASWGRGAGCSFVEDTCIGEDGQVPPSNKPFFCNAAPKLTSKGLVQEVSGCTPDLSRKAACSLGQYDTELPPEYQYFGLTYGGTVGGSDPFIDYCPTYTGFDNGLCSNGENAALLQVNQIERFGKQNSRCLSGSVDNQITALCLQIACVVEDRALHVKIDGVWTLCRSKDDVLKVLDDEYVLCPDPKRVCPTFYCHHDCLGTTGRCDYDSGACVCSWANATMNATDPVTGKLANNRTGVCKRKDSVIESKMLPADSLLAGIYVDSTEALLNDPGRWYDWQLYTLTAIMIIFGSIMWWHFRLRAFLETFCKASATSDDDDGTDGEPAENPGKDKVIAGTLIDIRMNGGISSDAASVALTNINSDSLFELGSTDSCGDNDDRFSLASEVIVEEHVDVLADPNQPKKMMRKRRFKGPFSKN